MLMEGPKGSETAASQQHTTHYHCKTETDQTSFCWEQLLRSFSSKGLVLRVHYKEKGYFITEIYYTPNLSSHIITEMIQN